MIWPNILLAADFFRLSLGPSIEPLLRIIIVSSRYIHNFIGMPDLTPLS